MNSRVSFEVFFFGGKDVQWRERGQSASHVNAPMGSFFLELARASRKIWLERLQQGLSKNISLYSYDKVTITVA
jgi:hypothetical protein